MSAGNAAGARYFRDMETPTHPGEEAAYWRRRGAATARRLNMAWWLDAFAPAAILTGFLVMAAILFLRSRGIELEAWQAVAGIGGLFGIAALIAWMRARPHFITEDEGMVRVESHLQLHNALSAASAGVRAWPQAAAATKQGDGLRWRTQWIFGPLVTSAACIVAAFLVPVPADARAVVPTAPPRAQQQIADMLQKLEEKEVMKKEDLEKVKEQLEQIRKQKPEEWYSHNSLEAADTLKQHLEQAASNMAENLDKAAKAMDSLQKQPEETNPAEQQRMAQEFENAVKNLSSSTPAPNQKMMEGMQKAAQACKDCQGKGKGEGEGEGNGKDMNDLMNDGKGKGKGKGKGRGNGQGDGEGDGEGEGDGDGKGAGKGGIGRGPGTAPLEIGKESNLGTNNLESVEGSDFSRALPGDGLGTRDGEHEIDKSATGPVEGGDILNGGDGGDAVGRESLLPQEKNVLKKYFR